MDCLFMKRFAATAAALACLATTPALAQQQDSRTYFTARLYDRPAPQQLSPEDREYYSGLFSAIESGDWGRVESILAQRPTGLRHDVARAG